MATDQGVEIAYVVEPGEVIEHRLERCGQREQTDAVQVICGLVASEASERSRFKAGKSTEAIFNEFFRISTEDDEDQGAGQDPSRPHGCSSRTSGDHGWRISSESGARSSLRIADLLPELSEEITEARTHSWKRFRREARAASLRTRRRSRKCRRRGVRSGGRSHSEREPHER